ncbi:MAG: HipA domain-containing protein, partial [Verrucomicrobiota bacterium]
MGLAFATNAAITGEDAKYVAKFSISTDTFPIVKAEYVAMMLAVRVGLNVATVSLEQVAGKDVLLVKRFDRNQCKSGWSRRALVSALTVLGLDERWAREATYPDLVDRIRVDGMEFRKEAMELFSRLVFNVLIGNTDDHARNHSFFVEGLNIRLTPAYDLTPFPRAGGEAGHG